MAIVDPPLHGRMPPMSRTGPGMDRYLQVNQRALEETRQEAFKLSSEMRGRLIALRKSEDWKLMQELHRLQIALWSTQLRYCDITDVVASRAKMQGLDEFFEQIDDLTTPREED